MKKIRLVFLLMFCVLMGSSAFTQTIIDANGDNIASIDSSGVIKDMQGMVIGEFTSNGDVKDMTGVVIGEINGSNIKDGNGALLATVNTQGEIHDMNSTLTGSVQFGVMMVDVNNHVLLRTDAVMSDLWFAAYYLFFNNDDGI